MYDMREEAHPLAAFRNEEWCSMLRLLLAALSLAVLACSDPPSPALSFSTTAEWTPTEDLRIGSVDDSATALTRVGSVAVDSAGRIYVSQPMDHTIRVFESAGNSTGVIGGFGEGPGEFKSLTRIGLVGDTLYATDAVTGRVTFFSSEGQLLGTTPLVPRELGPGYFPRTAEWLATGGISLAYTALAPNLTGSNSDVRLLYVHIDRSGETLDTAALWVLSTGQTINLRGAVGPLITPQLFLGLASPVVSADGSRVAMVEEGMAGDRPTFQVTAVRSTRDTVWAHEYSFEPVPISAQMVDSAVAQKAAGLNPENFPDRVDAERQIREGLDLPDHLAPVSDGVFADNGDLWLRREGIPGEDQRWSVLDSTGAPVGRITLPRGLAVKAIRSNTLLGVETDPLDVPYLVRYVITMQSPAG